MLISIQSEKKNIFFLHFLSNNLDESKNKYNEVLTKSNRFKNKNIDEELYLLEINENFYNINGLDFIYMLW
jgi:hypothetical protein